jgi:hypothetical protein
LERDKYVKVLSRAFDAMSLPFLTQLQISTLDVIDSHTWVKTFGKLPLLEQVSVKNYAIPSFLQALVYKTNAAEKSKTAYCNISFPKLRYIHLNSKTFDASVSEFVSVDMLLHYLTERREISAEVQVLRLDDCYCISPIEVERLKEVVDDVFLE